MGNFFIAVISFHVSIDQPVMRVVDAVCYERLIRHFSFWFFCSVCATKQLGMAGSGLVVYMCGC
jgi:hypothetical protein